MAKEGVERKPRKKRETGINKKALSEIRHLAPHFTSRQLAARIQISLEQAQKTCSYLKLKGYVKVVGYAKLEGLKGIPESLYGITEVYEKARKKNPSLFDGLKVVPTPIEKARETKQAEASSLTPRQKAICQKVDGVIAVIDELVSTLLTSFKRFAVATETFGIDDATKIREQLKNLKEIKMPEAE